MTELESLMADAGFYLGETGGGCTAFSRADDDGTVVLITRAEDAEAPERIEEACTVGRMTPDGEWELLGHADDVVVALAIAKKR